MRLYVVQPKGLQEGRLAFALPAGTPPHAQKQELGMQLSTSPSNDIEEQVASAGGAPEEQGGEAGPAAVPSSILQQQSQQLKNLLMRSQVHNEQTDVIIALCFLYYYYNSFLSFYYLVAVHIGTSLSSFYLNRVFAHVDYLYTVIALCIFICGSVIIFNM